MIHIPFPYMTETFNQQVRVLMGSDFFGWKYAAGRGIDPDEFKKILDELKEYCASKENHISDMRGMIAGLEALGRYEVGDEGMDRL